MRVVAKLVTKLCESQLMHPVQVAPHQEAAYTIARPPEQLALVDVLRLIEQLTLGARKNNQQPGWDFIEQLDTAQHETAGQRTVADLLDAELVRNDRSKTPTGKPLALDPSDTSE